MRLVISLNQYFDGGQEQIIVFRLTNVTKKGLANLLPVSQADIFKCVSHREEKKSYARKSVLQFIKLSSLPRILKRVSH